MIKRHNERLEKHKERIKALNLKPLSEEEKMMRRPAFSPDIYVSALNDPIHKDIGKSRPAKTIKSNLVKP